MEIIIQKYEVGVPSGSLLVLPVFAGFSDVKEKTFSKQMLDRVSALAKKRGFSGKLGQQIFLQTTEDLGVEAVMLIGLGEKGGDVAGALREGIGLAVTLAKREHLEHAVVLLHERALQKEVFVEGVVMAAELGNYVFDKYKKRDENEKRLKTLQLSLTDSALIAKTKKGLEALTVTAAGVALARNLTNTGAEDMTPSVLAEAAAAISKSSGGLIKLTVLHRAACEKLGMGSYLAVAKGSDEEPKFIHLTYTSPRSTKKTVAVVGKGVTFDSGGLSLKPADGMMTMKCDMAGAAAVLGLFHALATLKPRVNVHGIIAATENMPSGKAIRPGDIVKSMSGKTIEILNTDAEGRLTLADALTYVIKEAKPDVTIDLATLTGACMVGLGEEIAGLMTNNKELGKQLLESAKKTGEKLWELPLEHKYRQQMLSDVADLRNIATSRYGGSITAGLFLQEFVENKPWAHLDIAGPAFAERPMASYLGKGGTGYGVRTLVEFLKAYAA